MLPVIEPLESRLQLSGAAGVVPLAAPASPPVPRDSGVHPLLPDLLPWVDRGRGYLYQWVLDRQQEPGHLLLRLTSAIANAGGGPMELIGGPPHPGGGQDVYQRIYNSDGSSSDRLAGVFTYHPSHHHIHFDDFAMYRLRRVSAGGGVGAAVGVGHKTSFCLTDSDIYNPSLPGFPANGDYFECGAVKQGISVGWADVYSQWLPDQWIDVTNVKPGKYWLEVTVDPHHHLVESNTANNTARILINLRGRPKAPFNRQGGSGGPTRLPFHTDAPIVDPTQREVSGHELGPALDATGDRNGSAWN